MEALGGYASSGSSEEEEEMATAAAAAGVPQSNAAALASEAARAERVAAMEKSDSDESEDSDESDSSDDSDDDEREAQEAGFRRGASKAAAVSLPSASELMAGGGALCDTVGVNHYAVHSLCFFSVLAQAMEGRASTTTRMSSRRSTQSESWATTRTTPFSRRFRARKRSTAKDQSPRPIPQSHALGKRRWPHLHPPALPLSAALRRTSGVGGALLPPQVARGRANTVTEDTSAWNVTKKKVWTCSLRQTSPRSEQRRPHFNPSHTHTHTHTPRCALTPAAVSCW